MAGFPSCYHFYNSLYKNQYVNSNKVGAGSPTQMFRNTAGKTITRTKQQQQQQKYERARTSSWKYIVKVM